MNNNNVANTLLKLKGNNLINNRIKYIEQSPHMTGPQKTFIKRLVKTSNATMNQIKQYEKEIKFHLTTKINRIKSSKVLSPEDKRELIKFAKSKAGDELKMNHIKAAELVRMKQVPPNKFLKSVFTPRKNVKR